MTPLIHVVLYGSLQRDFPVEAAYPPYGLPQPLEALLEGLAIPIERVQLAMVNHRAAGPATPVSPGDRVALFPPEYPIFADWLTFRTVSGGGPAV